MCPITSLSVENGQTIGAALVTTPRYVEGWLRTPSIFLGTNGEPRGEAIGLQSNRLLVSSNHLASFASGLMRTLADSRYWSQIILRRFVPAHAYALVGAGRELSINFSTIKRKITEVRFCMPEGPRRPFVLTAEGQAYQTASTQDTSARYSFRFTCHRVGENA